MLDTLIGNKCFAYSFSAGFIGCIVFLYLLESRNKDKSKSSVVESAPLKPKKISGECKMVLVVRKDLKATKREIAVQSVQACVEAYKIGLEKYPKLIKHWQWNGSTKVALKVNSEAELVAIKKKCDQQDIINYLVYSDDPSQKSALVLAVGPDIMQQINSVTGNLKLY